jgi:adenylate kinase
MNLVLIGPSGAGKGSLAEFLVRDLGLPHVSTGQILRDNIAKKTPIGIRAEEFVANGFFVPDEIIIDLLLARLREEDCHEGFILDGFPRTVKQAKLLAKFIDIHRVIQIDATDETIIARLGGRWMCEKCNTIHNTRYDDTKECRSCGNKKLFQRDDDSEEQIRRRLAQYRAEINPILKFYSGAQLLTVKSDLEDTPWDTYRKFLKEVIT